MEDILQLLVEEDFGYESGGGIWGRSANHDSLVVNEEKQFWFWNSKGIKGNAVDYLILVRGMSKKSALDYMKSRSLIVPDIKEKPEYQPPYEKLVDLLWNGGKNKRDYWYKRNLTDETIDKFRLGYYDEWYLIPFFEDGLFKNFQCRKEEPEKRIKQWYRHSRPVLFNSEILPFINTVYMTEGTVDAILLNQEGFPTVSQNGTNIWLPEWFEKFARVRNIFYVEDNDSAGRQASRLISRSLGRDRVKIVSYIDQKEKFDTVDFFKSGKTKEDFREYVKTNSKFLYEME